MASFGRLGSTVADRAGMAAMLEVLGRQSTYLLPLPEHVELLPGYLQWFLVAWLPIFFGAWAAVAGTGALRGEDERGLIEQWLGMGLGPVRLVYCRLAGFGLALLATGLGLDLAVLACALATHQQLEFQGLALQTLAQSAPALPIFAGSMLAGRLLPTRRNALGATAIVLTGLLFLNGFSRSVEPLRPFRWFTPFAYSDLSDAMTPAGRFDLAATLGMIGVAILLAGLAARLLVTGDLGAAVMRFGGAGREPRRQASANPLMTFWVTATLWEQRAGLSLWSGAIAAYAFSNMQLARPFVDFFSQSSRGALGAQARLAFGFGARDPLAGFVGSEWFSTACLLLSAYAIAQVARWASEDAEGRLEMLLASGRARWQVVTERAMSLGAGGGVVCAANAVGVWMGAAAAGFRLSPGRVLLASVLMLPLLAAFAGAGAALAGWRPRMAVAVLTAVLVTGFFIPYLAVPIFKDPPGWFLDLSVLRLYGNPLVDGVRWSGLWLLLAAGATGFGAALGTMRLRDVGG